MHSDKLQAINHWPLPNSMKELRGFLGLTDYYPRFIKNYGLIAKPLTDLTKKNNFKWHSAATATFQTLKHALTSAPVLHLPDLMQHLLLNRSSASAILHSWCTNIADLEDSLITRDVMLRTLKDTLLKAQSRMRPLEEASWENYDLLAAQFPSFRLEDKASFEGEGIDTISMPHHQPMVSHKNIIYTYSRRAKKAQQL
ncbi:hypothetical protein ZIOFF_075056 [Zingiber officinale]|uniref:Reverse transcriptase n=1 Tax=Zingiber officinale TaxID=94328 RepID=A0A8J5B9H3_ZINOF|nr:hypothetical protein ZIOFF_075056 [Zingiber officinale]